MRTIDLATWPRRTHYDVFRHFDYPHFNLCANVEVTAFRMAAREQGVPFTLALVHTLSAVANALPEFRYRIRGEQVVEHEVVHPSMTILTEGDLFSFCTLHYRPDMAAFIFESSETMERVRQNPVLQDEPGQDNLLFLSAIPWVSFTSMMHPIHMHPVDSVPRISWGKFFAQEERLLMPLSVQGHHALMDGLHLGLYFQRVQERLDHPNFG